MRLLHDGAYTEALSGVYWAHVHGLACLLLDGPLGPRFPSRASRLRFLDEVSQEFAARMLGAMLTPTPGSKFVKEKLS